MREIDIERERYWTTDRDRKREILTDRQRHTDRERKRDTGTASFYPSFYIFLTSFWNGHGIFLLQTFKKPIFVFFLCLTCKIIICLLYFTNLIWPKLCHPVIKCLTRSFDKNWWRKSLNFIFIPVPGPQTCGGLTKKSAKQSILWAAKPVLCCDIQVHFPR